METPDRIICELFKIPAPIVFITGRFGSGKTDFALLIAEILLENGIVDKVGTNIKVFDNRFQRITNVYELKNWIAEKRTKKLFILDEAGIHIDARKPLSRLNREIRHLAFLLRKHRAKMILISQRAKDIESTFRDTDIWLATFQKLSKKEALLISNIHPYPIIIEDIPPTNVRFDTYDIAPFGFDVSEFNPMTENQELLKMWIDGYSMRDISRLKGIPPATVLRRIKEGVKEILSFTYSKEREGGI